MEVPCSMIFLLKPPSSFGDFQATFDFQRVNPINIPPKNPMNSPENVHVASQARVGQVNLISMPCWSKMRVWTLGKRFANWDPWRHFGPALHAPAVSIDPKRDVAHPQVQNGNIASWYQAQKKLGWLKFLSPTNEVANRLKWPKMTKDHTSKWFHFTSPNLHQNGWPDPTIQLRLRVAMVSEWVWLSYWTIPVIVWVTELPGTKKNRILGSRSLFLVEYSHSLFVGKQSQSQTSVRASHTVSTMVCKSCRSSKTVFKHVFPS